MSGGDGRWPAGRLGPRGAPFRPAGRTAGAAAILVVMAGACVQEQRVVRYKPFFAGLEGVQSARAPVVETPAGARETMPAVPEALIIQEPDGRRRIVSRTGVHLMHHVQRTLADDDVELFVEEVLAEVTKREYYERGLDPREAFATLKAREREIAALFARMPMGEHSPNVFMETVGRNVIRVRLTGPASRDLYWIGFDMILERGQWRLRWFF